MCVLCSGKQEILPRHFMLEQYPLLVNVQTVNVQTREKIISV